MLPWLFAGSAMLACSLVWRVDHVQPLTPETGATALLMRVDPEFRSLAYDYATHGFETPRTLLTKLRLQPSTRRPADSRAPIFGVSRFPAGAHRLHVVTSKAVEGTIVLRVGRSSPPLDVWTLKEAHAGSFSRPLRLPVEVQSLYVEAEDHLRASIASVSLQPWEGEDVLAPVTRRSADRAVRYDMATIYFLDLGAFPEASGFWVRGSNQTRVVVSNYGAPLRVFLRNAPVENTIAVEVDGDRREAGLHPGEETTLVIPRRRATPDVVVGIQTTSGFRPSETEPGSTDVRYLGCWVEIR
jgi:hypothetical protein